VSPTVRGPTAATPVRAGCTSHGGAYAEPARNEYKVFVPTQSITFLDLIW
jgi:hypothetical protein